MLFVANSSGTSVALNDVFIHATLSRAFAKVHVTQTYANKENLPIEAVFHFPLDSGATVTGFVATMGDRCVPAVLRERKQAQQEYVQALSRGNSAVLMEQNDDTPDIFTMNIGALAAGDVCKVEFDYVTELDCLPGDAQTTVFAVPTTIAPRYTPISSSKKSDAPTSLVYVANAPYTISMEVAFVGCNMESITSPSHPIICTLGSTGQLEMRLGPDAPLDRDILVHCRRRLPETAAADSVVDSAMVERNTKAGVTTVALALRTPRETTVDANQEFVIIVDESGSMQGDAIEAAKRAVLLFLKGLPMGCHFNIISFGSTFKSCFPASVLYTEDHLKEAEAYVSRMDAGMGGTEILAVMESVFSATNLTNFRKIILVTDGQVRNTKEIVATCKRNAKSNRIFTVGIGSSASRALVKGVAGATHGRSAFVRCEAPTELRDVIAGLIEYALAPSIAEVPIEWNPAPMYVARPSEAIHGDQLSMVYGVFEGVDTVPTITIAGVPLVSSLSSSPIDDTVLTHLAIKRILDEPVSVNVPSLQPRFAGISLPETEDPRTAISLRFGVICPTTAFVAVVEHTDGRSNAGMQLRDVPSQLPKEYVSQTGKMGTSSNNTRGMKGVVFGKSAPLPMRTINNSSSVRGIQQQCGIIETKAFARREMMGLKCSASESRSVEACVVACVEEADDGDVAMFDCISTTTTAKVDVLSVLVAKQHADGSWLYADVESVLGDLGISKDDIADDQAKRTESITQMIIDALEKNVAFANNPTVRTILRKAKAYFVINSKKISTSIDPANAFVGSMETPEEFASFHAWEHAYRDGHDEAVILAARERFYNAHRAANA